MRRLLLAAGLLFPFFCVAGQAHPLVALVAETAGIQVRQPWARATAPGQKVGAAYVTLTSPAADRLLGGSSPIAAGVEVHEMSMDNGVMRMRQLGQGLVLPAGQPTPLEPGGYHLMLTGLKQPLVAGQTVPVQLTFEHSPPMTVEFKVAPIGARGPGMDHGAMTGHKS